MANIYPTLMSEAFPDKKRVNEAKAKLEKAGVKYILSCWIDLLGIPKTKPIPISEFELLCAGKGPRFAVHSVSFVPELGPNDSDQILVSDLDSLLICLWDKTCAWVFSDLWWEDKPYNLCPRQTLKRAVKNAEDAGYRAFCGIEPEFIAMRWENGQPVKAIDDDPLPGEGVRPRRQAFGYDVEYSIDSMEFLGDMIDTLNELGWGLKDVVCEGAYSQFELDFTYTNVLQMADRLVFLRVLLKEIAKNHGMFVTFMPKPTIGDWRSGAHINFSLTSTANNKNIFEGKNGKFSDTAYHAVGGLIKHGTEITAVACSTVNSYNGLVPIVGGFEGGVHTWAPTQMAYGDNNRSCMLRLPQNRFCIENRAADMCMNPYLSLALTTAAVMDGIKNKIDPGKPLNVNLYTLSPEEIKASKIKSLPRNLLEAIEKLQHDDFAKEVLGESMLNQFFAYKMDEWDRYHQAVSDWEVTEYLRLY